MPPEEEKEEAVLAALSDDLDEDIPTGVFQAMTADVIQKLDQPKTSQPPAANFNESPALKDLFDTQNKAREHLKNIMLLARNMKP